MKKVAYLECPTGIAGDMCLGALVSAGVPLAYLIEQLSRLGISEEYELSAELVHRNGQQATKVQVLLATDLTDDPVTAANAPDFTFSSSHAHDDRSAARLVEADTTHHHPTASGHTTTTRHLPEIEQLIRSAKLPDRAAAWSLEVFRQLAQAEGAVHGIAPEQVHFHEVGATDAIVDIVGTCLGLDWLNIDQLYCSALPIGGGTVWAAHGQLPVPTPAVLKLWETRQVPIYSNGIDRELVTPTGAAIAVTLAKHFGSPPAMTLQRVGLGAGSRDLPIPNILRLWIGDQDSSVGNHRTVSSSLDSAERTLSEPQPNASRRLPTSDSSLPQQETISILETQIDDLNPQAIGYVLETLLSAGAVDVFTQAIGMKKSRPGILLTVICHPDQVAACEALLFRETSTLGIRRSEQQRSVLDRQIQSVQTAYGMVRVKVAWVGHTITNVQPEYEDCAQIAREQKLPWREVHRLTLQSWYQLQQDSFDRNRVSESNLDA